MSLQRFRIHRSEEERRARAEDADVNRAMEVLDVKVGAEEACISGSVQDIRCRLDAILDDLLPSTAQPALVGRVVRWARLSPRAKATDAAFVALFHEHLPASRSVTLCSTGGRHTSGEQVSAEEGMRGLIADALP